MPEKSVRGAGGGYRLSKPPEKIRVSEIVQLLEGGFDIIECSTKPESCERSEACVTRDLWMETAKAMYEKLNAVTLDDLLASSKKSLGGAPALDDRPGEDTRV